MRHGNRQRAQSIIVLLLGASLHSAQASPGATVPWTTHEAENMTTTGTVLGPRIQPKHDSGGIIRAAMCPAQCHGTIRSIHCTGGGQFYHRAIQRAGHGKWNRN